MTTSRGAVLQRVGGLRGGAECQEVVGVLLEDAFCGRQATGRIAGGGLEEAEVVEAIVVEVASLPIGEDAHGEEEGGLIDIPLLTCLHDPVEEAVGLFPGGAGEGRGATRHTCRRSAEI